MTKDYILEVIKYMFTVNINDYRTNICLYGLIMIMSLIVAKLIIKFVFIEMDFKIPYTISMLLLWIFVIYLLTVLGTFVYNENCYRKDNVIIPLIQQERYIEAFDEMNGDNFIAYEELRNQYYEEFTYQMAQKYESEESYIDAFIAYNTIINFRDSRDKAIQLIQYVKEELENE